jgi:predicted ATP-binding protein involved in virulence
MMSNNTMALEFLFPYHTIKQKKAQQEFESQKQVDGLTEAEAEELAVRKRRAEGTPCNKENFEAWKAKFEKEMAELKAKEKEEDQANLSKKKQQKDKTVDKSGRLTGFQHFSGKTGMLNIDEAMEAQWENAEKDDEEESDGEDNLAENVDEDLFDVDDEDLDDLDFDDDDDDDEEEEEPDI